MNPTRSYSFSAFMLSACVVVLQSSGSYVRSSLKRPQLNPHFKDSYKETISTSKEVLPDTLNNELLTNDPSFTDKIVSKFSSKVPYYAFQTKTTSTRDTFSDLTRRTERSISKNRFLKEENTDKYTLVSENNATKQNDSSAERESDIHKQPYHTKRMKFLHKDSNRTSNKKKHVQGVKVPRVNMSTSDLEKTDSFDIEKKYSKRHNRPPLLRQKPAQSLKKVAKDTSDSLVKNTESISRFTSATAADNTSSILPLTTPTAIYRTQSISRLVSATAADNTLSISRFATATATDLTPSISRLAATADNTLSISRLTTTTAADNTPNISRITPAPAADNTPSITRLTIAPAADNTPGISRPTTAPAVDRGRRLIFPKLSRDVSSENASSNFQQSESQNSTELFSDYVANECEDCYVKNDTSEDNIESTNGEEKEKISNGQPENDGNPYEVSSSPPDCPTCGASEDFVKLMRKIRFTDLLIQKLRLNVSESDSFSEDNVPKLPPSLLERTLRDNSREEEKDEFYARDQELIIPGRDMGRDCVKIRNYTTGCFVFELEGKIKGEIAEAQLWFYKMKDKNDDREHTFHIFEIEKSQRHNGHLKSSSNLIDRKDTLIKEDWVIMNVTRSVMRSVDRRKSTEMLALACKTCATKNQRALFGAKEGYKPLLMIKYVPNRQLIREKRSQSCDPASECCKRHLVVNFRDLHMHNIAEPQHLSIGYCYGFCDRIDQYTYNHTAVLHRLRSDGNMVNQPSMREQLRPCCVPLVLKDATIMTLSNGGMHNAILPKVIVESCGCM